MAEVKRNHDEYQANRNGGQNFASAKAVAKVEAKAETVVEDEDDDDDDEAWPF